MYFQTSNEKYLLPPVRQQDVNKKCVVIDLDETLVHSSFKVSLYLAAKLGKGVIG